MLFSKVPRRQRRHMHRDSRVEEALSTLAELDGYPPGLVPTHGSTAVLPEARQFVEKQIADFGPPPSDFSDSDGKGGSRRLLREILGVHAGYGSDESSSVVPLNPSLLALPSVGGDPFVPFRQRSATRLSEDFRVLQKFCVANA